MAYNLIITERAGEQLDNVLNYLVNQLKSMQAAKHLLSQVEVVYDTLEDNPFLYPVSRDPFLKSRDYREAIAPKMNYKIVFEIEDDEVTILGIFHQLENYPRKV